MNMNIQRINWKKKKSETWTTLIEGGRKKKDKWTWIFNELIEKKKSETWTTLTEGGRKKKDKWTWIFNELNEKKKKILMRQHAPIQAKWIDW